MRNMFPAYYTTKLCNVIYEVCLSADNEVERFFSSSTEGSKRALEQFSAKFDPPSPPKSEPDPPAPHRHISLARSHLVVFTHASDARQLAIPTPESARYVDATSSRPLCCFLAMSHSFQPPAQFCGQVRAKLTRTVWILEQLIIDHSVSNLRFYRIQSRRVRSTRWLSSRSEVS